MTRPSFWRPPSREARDTLFMLLLIGATVAPHFDHLPLWVDGLALGVLAWRGMLALRQAPLPGRAGVLALLAVSAALTWWNDRTLFGKEAGITLLVMLMALKTLELRARRDALVVFFLGFFLVLTHFLYSQSLPTAIGMGLTVWGWLTALTLAHMPAGRPSIARAARLAGRAALIGAPVMLMLFLVFPRLGPLWGLPRDGGRTGLSDRLEMGLIADLASDDSIAMRLRFDGPGPAPPADRLYFRGPVLSDTDGRVWRAESVVDRPRWAAPEALPAPVEAPPAGPAVPYELLLEPTQKTWLPLLELTLPGAPGSADASPPVQVIDNGDDLTVVQDLAGQWRTRQPMMHRVRLRAVAYPQAHLDAEPADFGRYLRLPAEAHPRTRRWAADTLAGWREADGSAPDADALADRLYAHIRTQGYSYTLRPGSYEGDPVDQFWLDRRAGFCEHFASAFVVVMRAWGVPARLVTGYQGVDPLPVDGLLIVRQSQAHAWAEYWRPGRGWTRADPTAAVAPDRIERGEALRPAPGLVGSAIESISPGLRDRVRAFWEEVDNRWTLWVLGYNRQSQFHLLRRLGFETPALADLGRVLLGAIVALSLGGAAYAAWDARRRGPGQKFWRQLAKALRPLTARGWAIAPHESPGAMARRLRAALGERAEPVAARLDTLERLRYGPAARTPTRADWRALAQAAQALAERFAPRDGILDKLRA